MSVESTELEVNSLTPANSYTPSHIHRYQSRCRLCPWRATGHGTQTAISTPADGLVAGEIRLPRRAARWSPIALRPPARSARR